MEKCREVNPMNHTLQDRYSVGEREQKGSKAEKDMSRIHRKKGQNWDCGIL